ncbi:unnamed protein product [Prunus armeniaca]
MGQLTLLIGWTRSPEKLKRGIIIEIDENDVEIGNLVSDNYRIIVWVKDPLFIFFFVEVPVAFDAEYLGILGCSDLLLPRAIGYVCHGWSSTNGAYHIDLKIGIRSSIMAVMRVISIEFANILVVLPIRLPIGWFRDDLMFVHEESLVQSVKHDLSTVSYGSFAPRTFVAYVLLARAEGPVFELKYLPSHGW